MTSIRDPLLPLDSANLDGASSGGASRADSASKAPHVEATDDKISDFMDRVKSKALGNVNWQLVGSLTFLAATVLCLGVPDAALGVKIVAGTLGFACLGAQIVSWVRSNLDKAKKETNSWEKTKALIWMVAKNIIFPAAVIIGVGSTLGSMHAVGDLNFGAITGIAFAATAFGVAAALILNKYLKNREIKAGSKLAPETLQLEVEKKSWKVMDTALPAIAGLGVALLFVAMGSGTGFNNLLTLGPLTGVLGAATFLFVASTIAKIYEKFPGSRKTVTKAVSLFYRLRPVLLLIMVACISASLMSPLWTSTNLIPFDRFKLLGNMFVLPGVVLAGGMPFFCIAAYKEHLKNVRNIALATLEVRDRAAAKTKSAHKEPDAVTVSAAGVIDERRKKEALENKR